jgi:Domain of unknown function (DUF3850)
MRPAVTPMKGHEAEERSRQLQQTVHELKCWPQFFQAIKFGHKRHDLRRADDREFRVGDRLLLREYDPETRAYTGSTLMAEVSYITSAELPCALSKDALHPAFAILSIKVIL